MKGTSAIMSRRLGHILIHPLLFSYAIVVWIRIQYDFHIYVVKNTGDCPMTGPIWGKFVCDFFALLLGT